MRQLYTPQALAVENGKFVPPVLPKSGFYYHLNPDMILFESEIQLEGKEGMFMLNMILETARHFKVSKIITIGAVPVHESYTVDPTLYCAANNDDLLDEFKSFGMKPADKAYIAGPSGLLPGLATAHDIKAGCILATVPAYAGMTGYPKAALALVKKISDFAKIDIEYSKLEEAISETNPVFEGVESQFSEQFPGIFQKSQNLELPDISSSIDDLIGQKEDVPGHIIIKIEELFKEAEKDKTKAAELKEELDRWDLYNKYEERFLGLFK